jgi:hypothetical protein
MNNYERACPFTAAEKDFLYSDYSYFHFFVLKQFLHCIVLHRYPDDFLLFLREGILGYDVIQWIRGYIRYCSFDDTYFKL